MAFAEFYVNVFFTFLSGLFLGWTLPGTQLEVKVCSFSSSMFLFSVHYLSVFVPFEIQNYVPFLVQVLNHLKREALVAISSAICLFQRRFTKRETWKVVLLEYRILLSSQVKMSDYPVDETLQEKEKQKQCCCPGQVTCQ